MQGVQMHLEINRRNQSYESFKNQPTWIIGKVKNGNSSYETESISKHPEILWIVHLHGCDIHGCGFHGCWESSYDYFQR